MSPDGKRLVKAGLGDGMREARIWDAVNGKLLSSLEVSEDCPMSLAVSPNSKMIICGGKEDAIRCFDAGSGRKLGSLKGHTAQVTGLAFSPDGKEFATASGFATQLRFLAFLSSEHRLRGSRCVSA
jgi:WD40 repeat protein